MGAFDALVGLSEEAVAALDRLVGVELNADVTITVDDGRFLYAQTADLADRFVLFATSGSGDEWLLPTRGGTVWFFDHDAVDLRPDVVFDTGLSVMQFLELATVLGQWEGRGMSEDDLPSVRAQAERISPGALDRWPYQP